MAWDLWFLSKFVEEIKDSKWTIEDPFYFQVIMFAQHMLSLRLLKLELLFHHLYEIRNENDLNCFKMWSDHIECTSSFTT